MTKRWGLLVGYGTLATLAGVGWLLHERRRISPPGTFVSEGRAISVGVETLIENPHRYPGELQVAGIVAGIASEQHLFSLADVNDRDEVLKTGDTACATLPVRWAGAMPALHDDVEVRGEVKESKGKLAFVASAVMKSPLSSPPGGPR